jgi:hypothetical protein
MLFNQTQSLDKKYKVQGAESMVKNGFIEKLKLISYG